ncbi:MAG: cytochrome bc complex cytochrome b subunit [Thaumarchaeota archaeon]|nr:cytochrome bc complex cytochrome b subunit [Nitrososphaerota archaeon]
MAEKSSNKDPLTKLISWAINRLERTIFFGIRIQVPKRFLSPLGFLGMLTTVTFIILGVTGGFLLYYYVPTLSGAFDSVKRIEEAVPYGFMFRNIHYHASNAMVFMAVLHLYYQYFSGRYKIRNEMLWVTGIILGTVTVVEAYTGYDLLFNDRAILAINIGSSLTNASPVIGPLIQASILGTGFSEIIIRFYALHVFILPVAMMVIMLFHFPRNLVFDIPMSLAISGSILMLGGLFPVDIGVKFDPDVPPGITVPEWYVSAPYAFIRTGYEKFTTGGLLPALFILMFLVVPFIDKARKFSWADRPFFTAIGIASIAQIAVTTTWGFYITPDISLPLIERLAIEPNAFYGTMIMITLVCFGLTYAFLRYIKVQEEIAHRKGIRPKAAFHLVLTRKWVNIVILALVAFQVVLNVMAAHAYTAGFKNLSLFHAGAILMSFSVIIHLYRYGIQLPKEMQATVVQAQPS